MEGVPSENLKALAHMTWDDRLKDARARRAEILRLKSSENAEERENSIGELQVSSFETVEKLRADSSSKQLPVIVEAPIAETKVRRGFVGLAFGAGITLGMGIMLFQSQILNRAPVTMEQGSSDALALDAAPKVPVALSEANGQFVAVQEITQPSNEQANVLTEIGGEFASVEFAVPLTMSRTSALETSGRADLGTVDVLPDVGTTPELVEVTTSAPSRAHATALLDTIASPRPFSTDTSPSGFGKRVVATSNSLKLAQEISGNSLADTEPKSIDRETAPGVDRAGDAPPPKSVTPEAIGTPIWIFASANVGEDVIETTQFAVESFDLSLQAVNRVNYRISRNQVRYYDLASAETAERLAAEIGAIPRDFTAADVNPPKGTLEIYLAGDAIVARSESSVSSPTVPVKKPQSSEVDSLRNSLIGKIRAGLSK